MRTYPQICFRNKQTNKQNETKEKKTKAKTKVGGKVPKQYSVRAKWAGQFLLQFDWLAKLTSPKYY